MYSLILSVPVLPLLFLCEILMTHQLLLIKDVSVVLPHKTLFTGFNAHIYEGNKIALIGRNGSGKTTLLDILQGRQEPSEGKIYASDGTTFGYVPQIIKEMDRLSGGQKFQHALNQALKEKPSILCLDEPTNHLDSNHRRSLMRMLCNYNGTLIIVSHDVELLRTYIDTFWHIDPKGRIHIFSGTYDDYFYYWHKQEKALEEKLKQLERHKKQTHQDLMREQERAKKRKLYGEKKYADDKMALRSAQGRGQSTRNKNRKRIGNEKDNIFQQLDKVYIPEVIHPKFSLEATHRSSKTLVSIHEGSCGYGQSPLLQNINLSLGSQEHLAIIGDNGSGKSTLLKAILGIPGINRTGDWITPKQEHIGYLDQHYGTLDPHKTVFETIHHLKTSWSPAEIRRFLNDFLFRKNEEVDALVHTLSGGEKARLSLAQIAAKTPKLLILDEMTNNLDLETRAHVIQVLQSFPSALITVSHDHDFLKEINIGKQYNL
jgi:ATPase subunit of ABC transporter with duplicated ATPase domains